MIKNSLLKFNSLIILISFLLLGINSTEILAQIPANFWIKHFPHPNTYENCFSIDYCDDNGYILGGFTTHYDAGDLLLIRTDSDGNVKWQKVLNFNEIEILIKVFKYFSNKFIVFSKRLTNNGIYFTVLDSLGNVVSDTQIYSIPNYYFLSLKAINNTRDNGFVLCGLANRSEETDIFLIKLDSLGNFEWGRYYYDFDIYYNYDIRDILQTSNNEYVACGNKIYPSGGGEKNFIIKFNAVGDTLWSRTYNFQQSTNDELKSIVETNNTFIIGGSYGDQINLSGGPFVINIDGSGNLIWSKFFPYNSEYQSMTKDNSTGYILTNHLYINGKNCLNLLQINSQGDSIDTRFIIDSLNIFPPFIIKNTGMNQYIIGCTLVDSLEYDLGLIKLFRKIDVQFFPYCDTALVFAFQQKPTFHIKLKDNLTSVDSLILYPIGNTSFIYKDTVGNLISTDKFVFLINDSLDEFNYELWFESLSPSGNSFQLFFDSTYYVDVSLFNLILKIKKDGQTIAQQSQPFKSFYTLMAESDPLPNAFSIEQNFPNPFNSQTKITWYSPTTCHQTIKLYDVLGNEIAILVDDIISNGRNEIIMDAEKLKLASGVYFYRFTTDKFSNIKKLIYLK